jgi:hypothetical protein
VRALQKKAVEKRVYISAGLALEDAEGKRWNVQIVIDPHGRIIGLHRKIWLTAEKGYTEAGNLHEVFDVKGIKMGICICADGTDRKNLQALVDNGAQIIYGPHANTTGGTIAGWYRFRSAWGGPDGWIAQMKVYAALHNHAALYNSEYDPPADKSPAGSWASGAWFIGPDGRTLAQMPTSTQRQDSKEFVLRYSVPVPAAAQETTPKTGTIIGRLVATKDTKDGKNTIIDVLAPGEEKARDYYVVYDPKIKGPIPSVLAAVRAAKVGDRVEFDWVQTGHGPAITRFGVLRKADGDKK